MANLTELVEQDRVKRAKTTETPKVEREVTRDDKRKSRIPIAGARDILTVDGKEEGFTYRWILAYPDRINRFKRAGWEVVTHEVSVGDARASVATQMGSAVEAEAGGGARMVLMRIETEYYSEDQDAKEAEIRALEESMGKDVEGGYGSIKITRDK